MNKILEFLYRHIVVIIFIFLELIAFMLMVNKNDLQRSVVFRYSTALTAWTYEVTNLVTDYFGLVEINSVLAEENANLRTEISDLEAKIESVDSSKFVNVSGDIIYISSKVVYNSVYDLQNFIIINKGSAQGVEADMGVIASHGVVGVVQRVSDNYAVVLPIINPDQVISAKLKKNNQLGTIVWSGDNPKKAKLNEIPTHIKVEVGDSIVTSGFSAIFPDGILIGVVDNVTYNNHEMFCDVDVNLSVDFQSLSYVTVASYKTKSELSELKKIVENEKRN